MASRRKLKKIIQFASGELMENVLFKSLMAKKDITEKLDTIMEEIARLSTEFTSRAAKPDAKDNPKLVKKYYKKLFEDWDTKTSILVKEIDNM